MHCNFSFLYDAEFDSLEYISRFSLFIWSNFPFSLWIFYLRVRIYCLIVWLIHPEWNCKPMWVPCMENLVVPHGNLICISDYLVIWFNEIWYAYQIIYNPNGNLEYLGKKQSKQQYLEIVCNWQKSGCVVARFKKALSAERAFSVYFFTQWRLKR